MRSSTILFHLARHLLYNKYRDPGEEPKLHLFGQLKRITRQWLEGGYLRCSGGTYPAQVIYQEIADMAAERIKAAITLSLVGDNPVKAILDAYNPTGSTAYVNFTTSKETRWQTDPRTLPRQLGGLRQRLGSRVLPGRRGAPEGARLRQEPEPRA